MILSSPCKSCSERLPDYDCATECEKRVDYYRQFGDNRSPVPIHLTIQGRFLSEPPRAKRPKTRYDKMPIKRYDRSESRTKQCDGYLCENRMITGKYCDQCHNLRHGRLKNNWPTEFLYAPKGSQLKWLSEALEKGLLDGVDWYETAKKDIESGKLKGI
jgi:hypothetical protein